MVKYVCVGTARSGRLRGDDCVADPARCEFDGTATAMLLVLYPVPSAPTSALYLAVRGKREEPMFRHSCKDQQQQHSVQGLLCVYSSN